MLPTFQIAHGVWRIVLDRNDCRFSQPLLTASHLLHGCGRPLLELSNEMLRVTIWFATPHFVLGGGTRVSKHRRARCFVAEYTRSEKATLHVLTMGDELPVGRVYSLVVAWMDRARSASTASILFICRSVPGHAP